MKKSIFISLLFISSLANSHSGGVDKQGGHINNKTGEYHCHRESCRMRQQNNQAVQEALERKRPFSLLYKREDWKHWSDFDNDCMNTRHEMLREQAASSVKLSPDGCYVSTGIWNDPFSGKTFTRASDLDVDHIIPLKWANDRGGANWSKKKKEQFANDPLNLLVVDDGLNQSKGAKGPTEWMPPNHGFRCKYLEHWLVVLAKYPSLAMSSAENRIFSRQLNACGLAVL